MRAAAIKIQKTFRAYNGRRKYAQMRTGFMRMQAMIRCGPNKNILIQTKKYFDQVADSEPQVPAPAGSHCQTAVAVSRPPGPQVGDGAKTTLLVILSVCRTYEKKLWAVIKIQSHIRKMIAVRHYRKMRVRKISIDTFYSY